MLIKAGISNRGFVLGANVKFSSRVVVLTGRNGSGKTRFLSAIQGSPESVSLGGHPLTADSLMNISDLTPSVSGRNQKVDMGRVFSAFDAAIFDSDGNVLRGEGVRVQLEYTSIDVLPMINRAARLVGKKPAELTHDELELHYYMPLQHVVGGLDVSEIFNQYLGSKQSNEFFEFRATVKGHDVQYLKSQQFLERFGPEPWGELNGIMRDVFGGKFSFEAPRAGERNFSRVYRLLNSDGGVIEIEGLSSGERVLLWLVLTIFTSIYVAGEFVTAPKVLMFDEPDAHLHPKMVEHMYWAFRQFCERFDCYVVITTHSPTTVALASEGDVFVVSNGSVERISKDAAISELLDGVSSIAVDPENRRQVYVESFYDVESFQSIYDFASSKSDYGLKQGVTLSFVSAGGKVPDRQLRDFIFRAAPDVDLSVVDEFVSGVNGVGSCTQVYGAVESLRRVGNKTVRGVVDWDGRNEGKDGVEVFSDGRAYAIENVTLDPLCMVDLISSTASSVYPLSYFTGVDVGFDEWAKDSELLQKSIESFVTKVLGVQFQGDAKIEYASGLLLKTDSRYLYNRLENGHDLERKIVDSFPELRKLIRREGDLKKIISSVHMTRKYSARFLPVDFLLLFQRLQAS